jgi:hypothetical protein
MAEEIIIKRPRGRPKNPPHLKTRRACFRLRLPDPDLLRLYSKLAGYHSVNAYAQSAFDALANQWRNHPEVQALLREKAEQKTVAVTPVSYDEVSIDDWLG